jgi:CheY-like chemotaxis protein
MTGGRTLQPSATDLHAVLEDLKLLAASVLPPGLGLSVLDNTGDSPVLLDAGMLQDALLNLVLNARDACGTSGQITISAHVAGGVWVVVSVSDTGPGFSDEALDRALQPFFTTKGSEGSGLGLPMVYDMVKLAGGDLQLANTPSGAQVTLRLPYRPAPVSASRGGLVLLVEDDDAIRADIREMLTGMGLTVLEATSADEAVALALDLPEITLVLSDINLAGAHTGLDLAGRLAGGGPPCILMTGLPPADPLHRQALGHAAVLQKPFTPADLAAVLSPGAAA